MDPEILSCRKCFLVPRAAIALKCNKSLHTENEMRLTEVRNNWIAKKDLLSDN